MKWTMLIGMAMLATGTAQAQTVATSNFSTSDDGWTNGDFTVASTTSPVTYNNAAGNISVTDRYGYNAFVAPSAYLGNQSAVFGGTVNFSLADIGNDNFAYSPLTLVGGSTTLFAVPSLIPSTDPAALTPYSIALIGANFRFQDGGAGPAATDAQLQAVLASLSRLGINADWQTGSDLAYLDNVSLCGPAGCSTGGGSGAVPEPASWALMILGFGAVGGAMRRRRTAAAFA